ncbi:hypothetical protein BBJ29_003448 [Phytophthora kernoviae]|uniref:Uncharacterized protein n=1 Tax=Phytophthora kernoviae TaxID=325452 RepID=A0A3F2RM46_9STRA|nr:hypothetical protein BBP00_00006321 [Phytophthora kernoviae]RLN64895.1 hypothetical protein BBJ29_003448 [Phytophthora kernoviae]
MADVTIAAVEQDANGWHEVEQTLTTLELPPVPPTSDPQRLLGYVLHILPRYIEMEMLATHLRLYASTLEQDMEQVKSHVRLLTREASGEREKKQFLERYAAQVVKERNDLLHSRGSSKKKTTGPSHFRSTLYSSLERKLYEVESVLTKHEKNKDEELSVVSNRVREAHARIADFEKENAALIEEVSNLSRHRDRLVEMLEETTKSKDVFAEQIDELSEKCNSLESEVEALQSEVDLLQTKDINDIRSHVGNSASSDNRSFAELEDDEEEKESDKDSSIKSENEGHQDEDGITEQGIVHNDLARDLYNMLNELEQKRKEEEQKASQAEQALLQFQQLQHGVQNMQFSRDS